HSKGRRTRAIERRREIAALPERQRGMLVEARGGGRIGRDEKIEAPIERPHLLENAATLAAGAHIVLRGEETGSEAAHAEILAERLGALDQLLEVEGEELALGHHDLDVG